MRCTPGTGGDARKPTGSNAGKAPGVGLTGFERKLETFTT
jgi:hypothetical protein